MTEVRDALVMSMVEYSVDRGRRLRRPWQGPVDYATFWLTAFF